MGSFTPAETLVHNDTAGNNGTAGGTLHPANTRVSGRIKSPLLWASGISSVSLVRKPTMFELLTRDAACVRLGLDLARASVSVSTKQDWWRNLGRGVDDT